MKQINFKECYNCKILKVNYYKYKKLKTVLNMINILKQNEKLNQLSDLF